jgi:adenosylcobinamide-GDP ribazoletransferase
MTMPGTSDNWRPWAAERAREVKVALAFLTRLPFTRIEPAGTPPDAAQPTLAQASWAFPLAGIAVGAIGAVVYAIAHRLGLPPWPAAALTVAATLAVTGALHEDGLADTADGFGGGQTREQKLAIMRDSRIGSYGVCALLVSILLRAAALASLAEPGAVAAALIAAHAGARAAMPALMFFLPPARSDGLSFTAGAPSIARVAAGAALALVVLLFGLGLVLTVAAAMMVAVAAALMAGLSERQIGGQTGDVLGATEQVCEIVMLLVALH